MRYKLLGKSGLRVSELALGTMTFGTETGWGATKEESRRIFDAYVEAGGNFIDTAVNYTDGTSENFLGDFMGADRQRYVLATKYAMSSVKGDPNASGSHRKNMVQSLETSLKRLRTDYVDLYWVHAWDGTTPLEEIMRALDDAVRAGKVLYVGISDTPAWVVARANTIAELRGWTPFVGLQAQYSLVERSAERDLLPMARALDLAVTTWASLGAGVLSGKYNQDAGTSGRVSMGGQIDPRKLAIAAEVVKTAKEVDCTPSQVALSWVRQQRGVIIPLLGARTVEQMRENLGCLEVRLTEEQNARLNQASAIELGFPHDFVGLDRIKGFLHGGLYHEIDFHR